MLEFILAIIVFGCLINVLTIKLEVIEIQKKLAEMIGNEEYDD